MKIRSLCVLGLLVTAAIPGGCAGGLTIQSRQDTAEAVAAPGGLTRRDITAGQFTLASWQKIGQPGGQTNIYIEGDGLAWLSKSTPSGNPTPKHPVALSLAAVDPSPNVIYIARPCQFVSLNGCPSEYWMGKRFAAEVVESYQSALNQIAAQNGAGGFHLIGYSGGANIAALLAERRSDVLSLRTVAGNIDNDAFTNFHHVSAMPYSLNAADEAVKLANIPQMHFIGGRDEFVPQDIYLSFARKVGPNNCLRSSSVPEATHSEGWVENWRSLLSRPIGCE